MMARLRGGGRVRGARPGFPRPGHGRGGTVRAGVLLLGLIGVVAPPFTGSAYAGSFPGANGIIAFASAGPHGVDIFTVRPDGSHLRRLINTPPDKISAYSDWSPDGRRLVFDSNRSGNVEIYLRTAAGDVRRLTNNAAGDSHPTWTVDGRRVAFESDRSGTKQVYIMGSDGSHVRQVTHFVAGAEEPSYSPTGQWIACLSGPVRRTALFVVRPDGTGVRQVTPRSLNAGHPSWSPDGRRIAFNTNIEKDNGRIWTVSPDGDLRQLSKAPQAPVFQ